MEDRKRSFEAVKIGMVSVETGSERFGTSSTDQSPPPVAMWGVNLTALSQKYNLYFVASCEAIHVYEPRFPWQTLGARPQLTVMTALANANAPGYIYRNRPHVITHLTVDALGDQEIVLVSTDSGNVTAYYTSAVYNAVQEAKKDAASAQGENLALLRPFFSQWVKTSAWGLAVHSEGRMIAVSSNTRREDRLVHHSMERSEITVFAFALVNHDQYAGSNTIFNADMNLEINTDWHPWEPSLMDAATASPFRDKNYKIVLAGLHGHASNVPCISFINSKHDANGTWLLSTDIDAEVKLWRIWKGVCHKTWRLREQSTTGAAWLAGGGEMGWIVAPLEKSAFRPAPDMNTFIGHSRASRYWGSKEPGESFDLTTVARFHVPSNGTYFPGDSMVDHESSSDDGDGEAGKVYSDLSDSEGTADENDIARVEKIAKELAATSMAAMQHTAFGGSSNDPILWSDTDFEDDSSSSNEDEDDLGDGLPDNSFEEEMAEPEADFHDDSMASVTSSTSVSSYNTRISHTSSRGSQRSANSAPNSQESTPPRHSQNTRPKRIFQGATTTTTATAAKLSPNSALLSDVPDVPFLHCSTSQIRLFGSTSVKSAHLFCATALRQDLSPEEELHPLTRLDRLNMVEQIPDLGIVIIATQYGRCAVCSLTKRSYDGILGLRVDWMLPTKKQERAGQRPATTLLGIAVSPIQGRYAKTHRQYTEGDTPSLGRNRNVNGTLTTFDDVVIAAGAAAVATTDDDNEDSDDEEGYHHRPSPPSSLVSTKSFHWKTRATLEAWSSLESSRRYRLMMTYADMTVLTYELSRGVERADLASS